MNTQNVNKWLKALRSGEYRQGRGQLRNNKGEYCCLGVACEVYQKEGPGDLEIDDLGYVTSYDGDTGHLPKKVADWLGITKTLLSNGIGCIKMNDTHNLTFIEIANQIKEHGFAVSKEN